MRYYSKKMFNDWKLLHVAKSYNEAKKFATEKHNVCQYRRSDLKNETIYSFKCSNCRKYPLCSFEIKIIVTDNDMESVKIMSRNKYRHEENGKKSYNEITIINTMNCSRSRQMWFN